ncbi:protein-glutamate methylesterase [Xanthomonas citri pv. malvacearum str. GSPB1386]|uniref:chemotaxis protein CheB n=1 Tax=Xanthomonas TaxID=338 RepID=UPI000297623E|nr:chemotaxis protein CheB [Xanthomonas citri]AGI06980.1 Protein-glutamate methylesterase [Xanthomonas citri subsp. citri Aw12879]AJZ43371.1 Chemotaxis response regulator containing a CheY-like receiver domain and a methylesterase domain [Xanthomonas citri pv. citri]AJZ47988.1 Chemotaxis response regulator containing a CheY-like receiver domain and a methylesterase domain [Xanthomonas citri pv. citri]AJZ52607.1 Chemotaxis response regulator containing a CheY-like receiver domain and a methylest
MHRDVIAIGGSAGAVNALRPLFSQLPKDVPAAILVVLHLSARGSGIARTFSSIAPGFPVHEAQAGQELLAGNIYLAVPDRHLMVIEGKIVLGTGPRENMARPSIDALFRSVALDRGPRAVGVLLSGKLNDGVAGLEALQQRGGAIAVQDPVDAVEAEMPSNALERVGPDAVVPGAGLATAILQLLDKPVLLGREPSAALRLEVDIAWGRPSTTELMKGVGQPSPFSCPACGGVLTQVAGEGIWRFRCQVGHAYTADALDAAKESSLDEALRVALRVMEERAELVTRLAARDGRAQRGGASVYADRAADYRAYVDVLRNALLSSRRAAVP